MHPPCLGIPEKQFFEALSKIDVEEQFLDLPERVRWMGSRDFGRSMFVRESYKEIFRSVSEKLQETSELAGHDFIITGTPGVGKSFFALYWLFKRIRERKPVLLEFGQEQYNCYFWEPDKEVVLGTRGDFRKQLRDPEMLYLSDAREDISFIHNCQTVLFSSPRDSNFHDFLKSGAEMYIMPLWSMEELEVVRKRVYRKRVCSVRMARICAVYGPIPRYALQVAAKRDYFGNWSEEELRNRTIIARGGDRLGQAVASADISLYFEFQGYESGNYSTKFSFLILHMTTTDFLVPQFRWASTYVWDKLMEMHAKEVFYFAHRLVFGASKERKLGSLAGHTFENLMHDSIRRGCASGDMKMLSKASASLEPPLPNKKLPRMEYNRLDQIKGIQENVYYCSERQNEPAVDSFVVINRNLIIFQFTVAERHPIDARALEKVIAKVFSSFEVVHNVFLIFVVPEYRFVDWKFPQRFVSEKVTIQNPPERLQRVVQYALYVKEEAARGAFPDISLDPLYLGKRKGTEFEEDSGVFI